MVKKFAMVDLSYLKRRPVLLKAVICSLSNKFLDGGKFWEILLIHWEFPLKINWDNSKFTRNGPTWAEMPPKGNSAYRKITAVTFC
jgi:hypothetical protein